MQVILNKTVDELGSVGEVVSVKDGYARNYLFPRGLASEATAANIKIVERLKAKEMEREKVERAGAEALASRINGVSATLEVNAGEDDKLFGSVTAADIQRLLGAQGVEVEKKDVLIKSPIRKLGTYDVEVRCHSNVRATMKLTVIKKAEA